MKELTDKPFGVNLTVLPPGVRVIDSTITKEDYLPSSVIFITTTIARVFIVTYKIYSTNITKNIFSK